MEQRALEVIDCDVDHAKCVGFNMLFAVWRYRTTTAAFRRGIVAALELSRRYPEGVGVCHFLDAESVPPDRDTRAAFVDMLRMPTIKHFSVTHEGRGFKAAAVRSVISGAHALARPRFAHSVQVSAAAAARWHAEQQSALGRPETALQIELIVQELRRIQRERYPQVTGAAQPRR
jgi:hypothetical protein